MIHYNEEKIAAIERTWLTPRWIPTAEFAGKAAEDVHYLIRVIHELTRTVAELKNHVIFRPTGD